MTTLYAWLDVGCLECANPTTFRGTYDSEEDARAAIEASWQRWADLVHADQIARDRPLHDPDKAPVIVLHVNEDKSDAHWHGAGVQVIVVIETGEP